MIFLFNRFAIFAACVLASAALAAEPRVRPEATGLSTGLWGGLRVEIGLTERVAYRLKADALQVVIDLDMEADLPLLETEAVEHAGTLPGAGGATRIRLVTRHAQILESAAFEARAAGPVLVLQFKKTADAEQAAVVDAIRPDTALVMLDPGHGGRDPGAVREGVAEKDIALAFAKVLAHELRGAGLRVEMTRKRDVFLPLAARVAAARAAEADIFLSLHANTVTRGVASGPTVYVLADQPSDADAAAVADFENSADRLAGYVVEPAEDDLTGVLRDLSYRATGEASRALAGDIVGALSGSVGVIRSRPLRAANFRVLKAPDIPSVLVELGFLGHAEDRALMQNADWQAEAAVAMKAAVLGWLESREAPLSLQPQLMGAAE